jgi:uncharacterized membrane protein
MEPTGFSRFRSPPKEAAMRAILPVVLLALSACKPPVQAPPPVAPPARAAAPVLVSDFSQDITALGTEPFWNLRISGTGFTLTRPDHPDLSFTAPGATIRPGQATWTATGADGGVLEVKLFVSPCSDGMSDRGYPMAAEVVLGGETLRGCAFATAKPPEGGV